MWGVRTTGLPCSWTFTFNFDFPKLSGHLRRTGSRTSADTKIHGFSSPLYKTRGDIGALGGVPQPSLCPLTVQDPSVDIPWGDPSAAIEAGEAPAIPLCSPAMSLASAWVALSLWERTDYQGAAPALSVFPLVVSAHHSDWLLSLFAY